VSCLRENFTSSSYGEGLETGRDITQAPRQSLTRQDTAFNQWIQHWNFGHVFRHTQNALQAVLLLWTLAFNLLQLFVYRRLGRCRRPKDPTDTIRHVVEVMLREVATLPAPIPWATLLLNTS